VIQLGPLADKRKCSLFRVDVRAGGFVNSLQEIFQRIILRDTEKICLVGFSQVKGYAVLYPAVSHSCKTRPRQDGRRQAALTAGQSNRDCTTS